MDVLKVMLTMLPGTVLLFQIYFQWAPRHWILIHYGRVESFCKIHMIPPALWTLSSCCLHLVIFYRMCIDLVHILLTGSRMSSPGGSKRRTVRHWKTMPDCTLSSPALCHPGVFFNSTFVKQPPEQTATCRLKRQWRWHEKEKLHIIWS